MATVGPNPNSITHGLEQMLHRYEDRSRDDLLMSFVIGLITKASLQPGGFREIVRNTLSGAPQVLLLIAISKARTDSTFLMEFMREVIWSIAKSLIYSTYKVEWTEPNDEGQIFTQLIQSEFDLPKAFSGKTYVYGVPLYIHSTEASSAIHYIPMIHGRIIARLQARARENRPIGSPIISRFYFFEDHYKQGVIDKSVFASKNCQALGGILKKYFRISRKLESHHVRIFKINGGPGLGKSTLADYLVLNGIAAKVYRADTSIAHCRGLDPNQLLTAIFFSVNIGEDSCVIMIDELDKYFDSYVSASHYRMTREVRIPSPGETPEIQIDPTVTLEEHREVIRNNFLLRLAEIADRTGLRAPCAVILCTNNFETIFGNVDLTHHESLKSRLVNITFYPCDREDAQAYIRFYNQKLLLAEDGEEDGMDPDRLEELLKRLPLDLKISYRQLNHAAITCSYDFERLIEAVSILRIPEFDSPMSTGCSTPRSNQWSPIKIVAASSVPEPKIASESKKMNSSGDSTPSIEGIPSTVSPQIETEIPSLEGVEPPEPNPENFVILYKCVGCSRSHLNSRHLCQCSGCIANPTAKPIPDPCSDQKFEFFCHSCVHREPFLFSDEPSPKERNQFTSCFQTQIDKLKAGGIPIHERFLLICSLLSWMSTSSRMKILNAPMFRSLRWKLREKIYEFHEEYPGYITSNVSLFDYVLCNFWRDEKGKR